VHNWCKVSPVWYQVFMTRQSHIEADRGERAPCTSDRPASLAGAEAAAWAGETGGRALPARVAERPDPALWNPDEFLTLREAAALFWPRGPIREASLRTARRDGQLAVARIAGKLLTTRRAVEEMTREAMRASAENRIPRPRAEKFAAAGATDARAALRAKIEALVGAPASVPPR
jgi:hypothetical protein